MKKLKLMLSFALALVVTSGAYAETRNDYLRDLRNQIELSLPTGVASGDRALTVQFYTEANIKRGLQHEGSTIVTIPGNGNNDTIFLTGSKPVALKGRVINFDGVGVVGEIYAEPTYTGGTPAVYQNASHINPVAGESQIIVGATITDIGVLAFAPVPAFGNSSTVGKGGLQPVLGDEKNLKPNTAYLLRLRSLDPQPQQVSSQLSWYEGQLDLPLQ